MTLVDRIHAATLSKAAANVKVLTLDVERSLGKYFSFGPKADWLGPDKEIEPSRIIMVGLKWMHEPKAFVLDERMGHREMIEATWEAMSEADIITTYNGTKADIPWLGDPFGVYHLGPPAPYKHVDQIKTIRKAIGFPYKRLDYAAQKLLGKGKEHVDLQLWIDVANNVPGAMDRMARYCANDVEVEEDLYLDLLPWLVDQPHMGMLIGDGEAMRCYACGEQITEDQRWAKNARAYVREYPLYRCRCKAWNRGTWLLGKAQLTRPAR